MDAPTNVVDLRWEQVDLKNAILHVRRVKQGTPATHPLTGRELRALPLPLIDGELDDVVTQSRAVH